VVLNTLAYFRHTKIWRNGFSCFCVGDHITTNSLIGHFNAGKFHFKIVSKK